MPPIKPIQVPGTRRPAGHYSQAIVHGGLVYVSGQIPADLETGTPQIGTIEAQTELVLGNLGRILRAAGSGYQHLLQVTIFLSRIDDWGTVNATYVRILGDHRPARAVVPVAPLHYGAAIEVMAIAAVPRTAARTTRARPAAARKSPRKPGRTARKR